MHGSFTMNWSLEDLICYLILLVYSGVIILYMCFFYFVNGYKFDTFCNDYHTDMCLKSELTKAKNQDKIVRPKID
jgi:hypothetical protein